MLKLSMVLLHAVTQVLRDWSWRSILAAYQVWDQSGLDDLKKKIRIGWAGSTCCHDLPVTMNSNLELRDRINPSLSSFCPVHCHRNEKFDTQVPSERLLAFSFCVPVFLCLWMHTFAEIMGEHQVASSTILPAPLMLLCQPAPVHRKHS